MPARYALPHVIAPQQPSRGVRRSLLVVRACVALVMMSSVLNWLGWLLGNDALVRVRPSWPAMTPWTALLLFLLVAGVHAQAGEHPTARAIRVGRGFTAAAAALSLLLLAQFALNASFGIDTLWFGDRVRALTPTLPGRPAPETLMTFLVLAVTVGGIRSNWRRIEGVTTALLGVAVFAPFTTAVGYLADINGLMLFQTTSRMALPTAVSLCLIGLAVLAVRPDRRPLAVLLAQPDRVSVMRLLLIMVAGPATMIAAERALVGMGLSTRSANVLGELVTFLAVGTAVFAISSEERQGLNERASLATRLQVLTMELDVLIESSPVAMLVLTLDGEITRANGALAAALGMDLQQVVGRNWQVFLHPAYHESAQQLLKLSATAPQTRQSGRLQLQIDHGGLWADVSLTTIVPHDAAPYVICQLVDVTATLAAMDALRESEERARLMAENGSDVIIVGSVTGSIDWASDSTERTLGVAPAALLGRSVLDIVHPQDREAFELALLRVAAGTAQTLEARWRREDGSYLWMSGRISPRRDTEGRVIGRVANWRDISGEHAAREQLRASEERYRAFAENATDVVGLVNNVGMLQWLSPGVTALLGWQVEELLQRPLIDFVYPDDRPQVVEAQARVVQNVPQSRELRFITKAGGTRWLSVLAKPVADEHGVVTGRIHGWRDIQAEHEAREALAAQGELLDASLQALLDPVVIYRAVRDDSHRVVDFEYLDANEAACTYAGRTRAELIGSRVDRNLPGFTQSPLFQVYASAMDSGAAIALEDFPLESSRTGTTLYFDVRGRRISGDRLTISWRDVTTRREVAAQIASSEEHFRLLAENTADVVFLLRDGIITWISPSVREALGGEPEQWLGADITAAIHPDDLPIYTEGVALVEGGQAIVRRARMRDAAGEYHWIEVHAKPYRNQQGLEDGLICSLRVVDAEVEAEALLDRMARFDELTGLLNRGEALRRLDAIARTRSPGELNALLFCDLDRFKEINDTLGHAAGDEALRVLARRTIACVRAADLVARMGGDEIMVVLQGISDPADALRVAEKIRSSAAEPLQLGGHTSHLSLSIGVAIAHPGENADAVIARADAAMYQAKRDGRNRVIRVD